MVKHTQTIRRQIADELCECVDHFVGLVLKGLTKWQWWLTFPDPIADEERKLTGIFIFTLKGFHKNFWGTTKKRENKNFSYFFNVTFWNAWGGKD